MTCSICKSEEHFRANCTRGGSSAAHVTFHAFCGNGSHPVQEQPKESFPTAVPTQATSLSSFLEGYGIMAEEETIPELRQGRILTSSQSGSYVTNCFVADATEAGEDDEEYEDEVSQPEEWNEEPNVAWQGADLGSPSAPPGADVNAPEGNWQSWRPGNQQSAENAWRSAGGTSRETRPPTATSLPSSAGPAGATGLQNYFDSLRPSPSVASRSRIPSPASTPSVSFAHVGGRIFSDASSLITSSVAAQPMGRDQARAAAAPVGSSDEQQARTASTQALSNFSRLMATQSRPVPIPSGTNVQAMLTLVAPRLHNPVGAIEQGQHIRENLRQQRRETRAVQTQNAVVNNPLRAGQIFPDDGRAPWQQDVGRQGIPWFQPPQRGDLAEVPEPEVPTFWDGDEHACSICTSNFAGGERVIRLACRHMFHSGCWERCQMSNRSSDLLCPNGRGLGRMTAVWNFIAPQPAEATTAGGTFPEGSPDQQTPTTADPRADLCYVLVKVSA